MQPILEKYRKYLSLDEKTPSITLGEGNTPLVRSVSIGPEMGVDMYFKLEGCNPTGSFKDRGMVSSTAGALAEGYKRMICASTGNTAAACAAYGARFDLNALLFVPKGNVRARKNWPRHSSMAPRSSWSTVTTMSPSNGSSTSPTSVTTSSSSTPSTPLVSKARKPPPSK